MIGTRSVSSLGKTAVGRERERERWREGGRERGGTCEGGVANTMKYASTTLTEYLLVPRSTGVLSLNTFKSCREHNTQSQSTEHTHHNM